MCFSMSASFSAGVVLSAIGIASVKKVQTRRQLLFAAIPLIFAVQQISEGFLWLALTNPSFLFLRGFMTGAFLFFAQVIWPVCVPLSIFIMEDNKKRKAIQSILVSVGIVVSLYLGFCLISYDVNAEILGKHISYKQAYPTMLSRYGGVLYMIATILPPLFSSAKKLWMLSLVIAVSYIITALFYTDYIVSVWCFFASVISGVIYFFVSRLKPANKLHLVNN
jgi:hypothetical protein